MTFEPEIGRPYSGRGLERSMKGNKRAQWQYRNIKYPQWPLTPSPLPSPRSRTRGGRGFFYLGVVPRAALRFPWAIIFRPGWGFQLARRTEAG